MGEAGALLEKKNKEIESYKKNLLELSKTMQNSVAENKKLNQYIKNIDKEFESVRQKCDQMDRKSGLEISNLSIMTKSMQKKQLELLEQLSGSIVQHNLDTEYREQYLAIIRQLVAEQVRTQQYIVQITSERDESYAENNRLQMQLKKRQLDLVKEELNKQRETEKVAYLQNCLKNMEMNRWKSDDGESEKKKSIDIVSIPKETVLEDVKKSEEYQELLKDVQLLLSHRNEIVEMRDLISNLVKETC